MNESKISKLIIGIIKIEDCLNPYRVYVAYGVVPKTIIVKIYKGESIIRPFKEYNISIGPDFDEQADICISEIEAMAKEAAHEI